mmetsp:Transcript_27551/g.79457  ORF Transcript_27551/g.79457 Transcript_27551/m.79457 type:complete len:505 (+) Transcript_27551:145-1659(+)
MHPNKLISLFAFSVLLLVVIIVILLGVLEGILDVGVVGVNAGERSEKLIDKGRVLELGPASLAGGAILLHAHGQGHGHLGILVHFHGSSGRRGRGRLGLVVLRLGGTSLGRGSRGSVRLGHRHGQGLLEEGILVLGPAHHGGGGSRGIWGSSRGSRSSSSIGGRLAVGVDLHALLLGLFAVLALLGSAAIATLGGGRLGGSGGRPLLPGPLLLHGNAEGHGQLGVHVGIDAAVIREGVGPTPSSATGGGTAGRAGHTAAAASSSATAADNRRAHEDVRGENPGGDGHEVARPLPPVAGAVGRVDQLLEPGLVGPVLAHADDVDGHVVLLELPPGALEGAGLEGRVQRAADEDHDALGPVLVAPVLEGEARDLDGGGDVDARRGGVAGPARRDAVEGGQDLPHVVGRADEELGPGAALARAGSRRARHGDDPDGRFRVGLRLGVDQQVGRVVLRLQPRRDVVPVPHVFGVVQQDHAGFERHGDMVGVSFRSLDLCVDVCVDVYQY